MHRFLKTLACAAVVSLVPVASAQAAPFVLVFDVEDSARGHSPERTEAFSSRIARQVNATLRYRSLARAKLSGYVRQLGRARCSYPVCQAELVARLKADRGLATHIFSRGSKCAVVMRFVDQVTRTVGKESYAKTDCDQESLATGIDKALRRLVASDGVNIAKAPASKNKPVSREKLNQRQAMRDAQKGMELIQAGQYEPAKAKLESCIELVSWPSCYRNLGILYAKLEQFEKAVENYRSYIRLKPNASDAAQIRKMLVDWEEK